MNHWMVTWWTLPVYVRLLMACLQLLWLMQCMQPAEGWESLDWLCVSLLFYIFSILYFVCKQPSDHQSETKTPGPKSCACAPSIRDGCQTNGWCRCQLLSRLLFFGPSWYWVEVKMLMMRMMMRMMGRRMKSTVNSKAGPCSILVCQGKGGWRETGRQEEACPLTRFGEDPCMGDIWRLGGYTHTS